MLQFPANIIRETCPWWVFELASPQDARYQLFSQILGAYSTVCEMGVEGKVAWDPRSSAATHTLQLIGSYLYSSLSLSHVVSSPLCAAQPPKH